jgi:hypothetical protein
MKHSGVYHLFGDLVMVAGRFAPNTAAAPKDCYAEGCTISHTGTGIFKVLLDEGWPGELKTLMVGSQMDSASVNDIFAAAGLVNGSVGCTAANAYFEVVLVEADGTPAAADIAYDAKKVVHFIALFDRAHYSIGKSQADP